MFSRQSAVLACFTCSIAAPLIWAAPPKSETRQCLDNRPWTNVSAAVLSASEIDRLVTDELAKAKVSPAPLVSDEQFLRRVTLDLTGRLPTVEELRAFTKDKDPAKRRRRIDELLASEDYARRWAAYWREVFASRVTDNLRRGIAGPFENWLQEQFRSNRKWDEITRDILTAQGGIYLPFAAPKEANPAADIKENPATFFLVAHTGDTAIYDRTNETARVFLGIQIQCAQCHDHPYDGWKREQYHELAAYFGKVTDRPMVERQDGRVRILGFRTVSRPLGDHRMPDIEDPKKTYPVSLRFLDGTFFGSRTSDEQRRAALAEKITHDNYYFAAAFVNRMWGELLGRAIVEPVDDLGPSKEGTTSPLLARLAAGFKASGYDIKALLRVICNSETYQRQLAPATSAEVASLSAGASPKRLDADTLWHSLTDVLGPINRFGPFLNQGAQRPGAMTMRSAMPAMPGGPLAARFGPEGRFKQEFRFDPSLPSHEIEDTIPQVLVLMNGAEIQRQIQANGATMLGRLLSEHAHDGEAVTALYLRVLTRKPTDQERSKAINYIRRVNNRREAYEDLLWALLNSTEFQTKR